MKKIMIALAAVAMAIGANAASIKWTTPVLMAANEDGSFSSTSLKSATGVSGFSVALTFYAFDAVAEDWKAITTVGNTYSSTFAKNGSVSTTTTGYDFVYGTDYQYSAHYTYTAGGKEYTMDVGPTQFTQSAATANYSLSVAQASQWTAAPEPTSGLLLLIGMAGLALRRRRA